jgi:uncharacterized protein YajQ (UPF0234 family)
MPSFDVISEVDKHELTNAVDQANRELTTRFDFKGTDAKFELDDFVITQIGSSEFQLKQMIEILRARLIARKIDVRSLELSDPETNITGSKQKITVRQGIEQAIAKKLIATMKEAKLKVGDGLAAQGRGEPAAAVRQFSRLSASALAVHEPVGDTNRRTRQAFASRRPPIAALTATTSPTAAACVSRSVAAAS